MKFIDSFRFMASSLASLDDNLSEGLHKDKCIDCKSYLDYMMFTAYQLIFRCFEFKNNFKKDFNKDLVKRFASIYEFRNKDINTFILLLRKEFNHMNTWIAAKDLMKSYCMIKMLFIVV